MRLVIDERLQLHAKMTPRLAAILPRLEGYRRWLKNGVLSIENTPHNLEIITYGLPNLTIDRVLPPPKDDEGESFYAERRVIAYQPKTTPYAHQTAAIERSQSQRHFALFMEQGTGKSKVAIDVACQRFLNSEITGLLIVAPRGVHHQWATSQLELHCGVPYNVAAWPFKSFPAKLKEQHKLAVMCINIDAVRTAKGMVVCKEFLKAHAGSSMIVMDEAHRIRNHRSKSWQAMDDLGKMASYRMALTGTPIAKDLTDEWAILKWLDFTILGINYVTSFINEYCLTGGWDGKEIVGIKNIEKFRERVDPFTFRATKEEIGILPKAYEKWEFKLEPKQRTLMRQMKQMLIAQMDDGTIFTAKMALPSLLMIQQISNGFIQEGEQLLRIFEDPKDNPRIKAMLDWKEANQGPLVIWARFKEDVRMIAEVLGPEAVTYFGDTKEKDRATAIQRFLNPAPHDKARVFVSTPSAGGTGLNLQGACSRVLYFSNSENSIDRWQSEDRTHRIGTNGIVTYTDLVAKGSLDAKIMRNLNDKKMISELAIENIKEILDEID